MTKEEAAAKLNGNEYRSEGSRQLWAAMKAAGLVAVYGASDDLCELSGAINDEVGAYNGTTIRVTPQGLLKNDCEDERCPYHAKVAEAAATIEVDWREDGEGPCWMVSTQLPHATFSIVEDGEPYCIGIVFALSDVPALPA